MFKKRVILIDSDEGFLSAASSVIRASDKFQLIRAYNNCWEALKKIRDDFAEIIVMDIDFAEIKGTEFILKAREKIPGLEILVTSNYEDEEIVFSILRNGASGYLLKKNCISQLLDSMTILSKGGSPLDPGIARMLIQSMHVNEISPLSPRESSVLKLMVQGKRHALIAEELFISRETVKSHLKNIYRKLNVNSKAEAIRIAITDRLVAVHRGFYHQRENIA
jgi:DNA-binding NarL/FixJ family response regulator